EIFLRVAVLATMTAIGAAYLVLDSANAPAGREASARRVILVVVDGPGPAGGDALLPRFPAASHARLAANDGGEEALATIATGVPHVDRANRQLALGMANPRLAGIAAGYPPIWKVARRFQRRVFMASGPILYGSRVAGESGFDFDGLTARIAAQASGATPPDLVTARIRAEQADTEPLGRFLTKLSDAHPTALLAVVLPPGDTEGQEGFLLLHGPGIRPGLDLGRVDAVDVAPTIYAYLAIPPAKDLMGQPLVRAFKPGARSAMPKKVLSSYLARE
ncbi:hypothetical protein K8I61_17445, partial [bacterium]|nr:hypothetical protein [bacterium]